MRKVEICHADQTERQQASMIGFSEQIIIEDGRLVMGTWQGVNFCEYDGPRRRSVYVKLMGG